MDTEDNVCFNCLNKFSELNIIKINSLGYGSHFDMLDAEIHLCDECKSKTNPEWWKFEIIKQGYCEEYKYEEEIKEYINQLPEKGIELYDSMKVDKWECESENLILNDEEALKRMLFNFLAKSHS